MTINQFKKKKKKKKGFSHDLTFEAIFSSSISSDVPAPAWPESPGFGLALGGLGLRKL